MNERRMSTRSNSNASISSSLTSLDTVVHVTQPPAIREQQQEQTQRSHSLPSSTSTPTSNSNSSCGKTVSYSSSTGSSYSSESPLSTTSHSSSTSFTSSSSYGTYFSSSSSSCPSPETSSKMPNKEESLKTKRSLTVHESAGEEEILFSEPPSKVGKSGEAEGEGNTCECCCCCQDWSNVTSELVVLVACGSFNPITTAHLRMMGEWILLIFDTSKLKKCACAHL
ncbi:unnamed protein product [Rodentolepis nana]|uniref:CTP_transf_like domain-containing protein n=1 Tax=Rodentolepis nana TaxID=102285 RepID=A0A0R3TSD9_RODNA|nr:unnamed protein product [Rodentolepis nana]